MISAFTIIRNEEKYLQRMFDNLFGYVDEVIVIDQESDDNSAKICRANGAKVSNEICVGYSEAYQEKAKNLCTHDWILMVFPDEIWQQEALNKVRKIGNSPAGDNVCHAFRRIEYTDSVPWKLDHPNYQLRLMSKKYAKFCDLIHTSFLFPREIKHHDLFLEHIKTAEDRSSDDERFDTVYSMLLLKYKYSKNPWIRSWMNDYQKEQVKLNEKSKRNYPVL